MVERVRLRERFAGGDAKQVISCCAAGRVPERDWWRDRRQAAGATAFAARVGLALPCFAVEHRARPAGCPPLGTAKPRRSRRGGQRRRPGVMPGPGRDRWLADAVGH